MTSAAELGPYAEAARDKSPRLLRDLNELVRFHVEHCEPYARIVRIMFDDRREVARLSDLPFVPVRLFKLLDLASVPPDRIVKTLTSSGTTGQRPSRIFLDKATAHAQSRALTTIMKSYLGPKRLPMLVVDSPRVLKDRNMFSARGAGILGFSQFGRDTTYLLDEEMELATDALLAFSERHHGEPVFLFGFTFMVWEYLFKRCVDRGVRLDLGEGSILLHGGGWKKLEAERVSNEDFKRALRDQLGIRSIHNYYGMVEQTGAIHMECERGFFHAPWCGDVLVRDSATLDVLPFGSPGLVQVMSDLPRSYPGHVLLTEDIGEIAGEDDCGCGRRGRYFTIAGRLAQSELRGCSDTHDRRIAG
jgi:acyl-protein synthetase LuxE